MLPIRDRLFREFRRSIRSSNFDKSSTTRVLLGHLIPHLVFLSSTTRVFTRSLFSSFKLQEV